jgi:hypothetical protein
MRTARGAGRAVAASRGAISAIAAAVLLLGAAAPVLAQDTHLVVITGVAGDDAHTKQFHAWAKTFIEAAKTRDKVPDANIIYLAEKVETDPALIRGRSTREVVEKTLRDIAATAKPNDEVFVLLIGHGSFDGKLGTFNLPGPDLTAEEWTRLLSRFTTQRVVFVDTSSSSGAFLPTISAPGRTVVTATKTGGERNETRFAEFFVEAFGTEAADLDRNGHVSVLEAFNYAKTKVAAAYQQGGLILTEHATLEDLSDGKLAAMTFVTATPTMQIAGLDVSDPAVRALVAERDAIDRQISELKLAKDGMDPARYDQELERLLTALALKTRAIRDLQAKQEPKK